MQLAKQMESYPATSEQTFEGVGGLTIFTRSWRPAGQPRGVVVIAPGFNSHSGQYGWVAEQFVAAGLAVYALDHRGRGKSGGERFHVEHFADYVDDLTTFISRVKFREPRLPVFLLGHSAGGVISSLYAIAHQPELAGLISESFAFELPAPGFALAVLKGVGRLAPHLRVLKLKNEDFSRDPEIVESMNVDPLIAGESQTARTVAELIRADETLKMEFPRITLPLLILHGTADKAAKPSGSQFFHDTAGSKDKTLRSYDGAFHDPLNDIDRANVLADIVNWIDAHLAAG
ncbi:alpha/beta hydrolase [Bradyrhizobium sp. McL0616]|uniref:alpha/beta hydrolase n=1 Tax=Bradyrhizobium sp. McL0616 TaxID=3415674 RepID=UPI003CE9CD3B